MRMTPKRKNSRPANITRTLDALAAMGYELALDIETFNPHAGPFGKRQDMFGLVDVYACSPGLPHRFIQVCGADVSVHVKKYKEEVLASRILLLLQCPESVFELWSWRKVKLKPGAKAERWRPRIITGIICEDGVAWVEEKHR